MTTTSPHPRFLERIPREFAREHLVFGEEPVATEGSASAGQQRGLCIVHAAPPRTDPLILHNIAARIGPCGDVSHRVEDAETIARRIDDAYIAYANLSVSDSDQIAVRADREDAPTILLDGRSAADAASLEEELQRLATSTTADPKSGEGDLLSLADKAPVVRLVDAVLFEAIGRGASDIHIQPLADATLVRFRVDGVLLTARRVSPRLAPALVSRIKIMARLDVAERRAPQDGRATVTIGSQNRIAANPSALPRAGAARAIDLRIATLPSAYGERVVIRLLDTQQGKSLASLSAIGMPETVASSYCDRAARSSGIVLVTGPTGSGKTTTLYATLRWIARRHGATAPGAGTPLNILTIEDPIEYDLSSLNEDREGTAHEPKHTGETAGSPAQPGPVLALHHTSLIHRHSSLPVSQTQVDPRKGLTFATGLRHILRQDPDVIMVGEIRDLDTARIAIQASLTGHLVFSTLHTADAPGAITRLLDLGIEPYLVASSLSCVLAQRLVRLTHRACEGAGCVECLQSGFKGRRGIFELLSVDASIRDMIAQRASATAIRDAAISRGMERLEDQGTRLANAGITTLDEVRRVTLGAEG